jgi:ABC-type uncharacterized transport system substrate-binding protein
MPLSFKITAVAIALLAACGQASAHPHTWVITNNQLVFDDQHRLVAIKEYWIFDVAHTRYLIGDLDMDATGHPTTAALEQLAQDALDGLRGLNYYTAVSANGVRVRNTKPLKAVFKEVDGDRVSLAFELPLQEPVDTTKGDVKVLLSDPTSFMSFEFQKDDPIKIGDDAPVACRVEQAARPESGPTSETAPPPLISISASFTLKCS